MQGALDIAAPKKDIAGQCSTAKNTLQYCSAPKKDIAGQCSTEKIHCRTVQHRQNTLQNSVAPKKDIAELCSTEKRHCRTVAPKKDIGREGKEDGDGKRDGDGEEDGERGGGKRREWGDEYSWGKMEIERKRNVQLNERDVFCVRRRCRSTLQPEK
jgi:hypothetical protein